MRFLACLGLILAAVVWGFWAFIFAVVLDYTTNETDGLGIAEWFVAIVTYAILPMLGIFAGYKWWEAGS